MKNLGGVSSDKDLVTKEYVDALIAKTELTPTVSSGISLQSGSKIWFFQSQNKVKIFIVFSSSSALTAGSHVIASLDATYMPFINTALAAYVGGSVVANAMVFKSSQSGARANIYLRNVEQIAKDTNIYISGEWYL